MKSLDEVIEWMERCLFEGAELNEVFWNAFTDALFYLRMYRSDSRQWEADRKNWESIRFTAVDEYNEARDRLIAKCKALEIGTLNEPLTWDELQEMKGKAIWVEESSLFGKGWSLITGINDEVMFTCHVGGIAFYSKDELGKTWNAYRKER